MTHGTAKPRAAVVHSVQELLHAVQMPEHGIINIAEDLYDVPPFVLPAGKVLQGLHRVPPTLFFSKAGEAVQLKGSNALRNLCLRTEKSSHAIFLDPAVADIGILTFEEITTTGRVTLIANAPKTRGLVEVRGMHIEAADAVSATELPRGFGVAVLQGAFTLWVTHADSSVTADLLDVSVGRPNAPVRGSGIFIAGADFGADTLFVQRLRTGPVYVDGGLPTNIVDRITGGVFVLQGANADLVENLGPVMTYGVNDMALDNWGTVERWITRQKVTTYGQSGIGFVNFGDLKSLRVEAPIETHGLGARGFNVYSGTVLEAVFDKITTRGDGAVGVQISKPVGRLRFRRGITTYGGAGMSLVKGVQQQLKAVALSIKSEGTVQELVIEGDLITHGKDVPALEQAGHIGRLLIEGEFASKGGV